MSGYMAKKKEVAGGFKDANQLTLKQGNYSGLLKKAQCYMKSTRETEEPENLGRRYNHKSKNRVMKCEKDSTLICIWKFGIWKKRATS